MQKFFLKTYSFGGYTRNSSTGDNFISRSSVREFCVSVNIQKIHITIYLSLVFDGRCLSNDVKKRPPIEQLCELANESEVLLVEIDP